MTYRSEAMRILFLFFLSIFYHIFFIFKVHKFSQDITEFLSFYNFFFLLFSLFIICLFIYEYKFLFFVKYINIEFFLLTLHLIICVMHSCTSKKKKKEEIWQEEFKLGWSKRYKMRYINLLMNLRKISSFLSWYWR